MRHGTIAVLAAAMLVGVFGCKQEPENKRISVDQDPPFRAEADLVAEETAIGDTEIAIADIGADDGIIDTGVSAEPGKHVIVKGDTLYSLAKRYLGHGRRWKDIQAANPGLQPKKLRVGQEIVIPAE